MSKPRILQIVRPVEGGILVHLKNLLEHLAADFDFTVACPKELAAELHNTGADILPLPLVSGVDFYRDIRVVGDLAKIIRSGNFVLLHAHGFKAGLVARPAARMGRVPCLVTVHNDFAGAKAARLRPLYYAAERWLSRWTAGYVTVSRWLAAELADECGVRGRIAVIPNGIILSGWNQGERCGFTLAGRQPLVGTVARLAPQKGVEFFIRAAARLAANYPELRFLVVGDGPLRPGLESLAGELGLGGRLFFMGHRTDVASILSCLSVFVQPSLSEGQGITVLEAMAAGCPVVASAVGGLREVIRHGENGLLVEAGSADTLAEAVGALLDDKTLAGALAKKALCDVREYDISAMLERTRDLYQAVMEGGWPHEMR
jgi:glycosyltransferase involved in cell wall biosynthesis